MREYLESVRPELKLTDEARLAVGQPVRAAGPTRRRAREAGRLGGGHAVAGHAAALGPADVRAARAADHRPGDHRHPAGAAQALTGLLPDVPAPPEIVRARRLVRAESPRPRSRRDRAERRASATVLILRTGRHRARASEPQRACCAAGSSSWTGTEAVRRSAAAALSPGRRARVLGQLLGGSPRPVSASWAVWRTPWFRQRDVVRNEGYSPHFLTGCAPRRAGAARHVIVTPAAKAERCSRRAARRSSTEPARSATARSSHGSPAANTNPTAATAVSSPSAQAA